MIKNIMLGSSALMLALSTSVAQAQQITVSVQNLTHGITFTPLLISAHNDSTQLFQTGMAASSELQMMAEGGDISGLKTVLDAANATTVMDPAGGLLGPGDKSPDAAMDTGSNGYLSVVAMMLPTNDGFIGVSGWKIPTAPGTYMIRVNGYDAGTEANDEIINGAGAPGMPGIPAAPGGNGGMNASGVTGTDSNTMVHIHRGNLGDTDPMGGVSDVDSRIHRWLNPVARVTVTVQ